MVAMADHLIAGILIMPKKPSFGAADVRSVPSLDKPRLLPGQKAPAVNKLKTAKMDPKHSVMALARL
jgi:hypothetical protein